MKPVMAGNNEPPAWAMTNINPDISTFQSYILKKNYFKSVDKTYQVLKL